SLEALLGAVPGRALMDRQRAQSEERVDSAGRLGQNGKSLGISLHAEIGGSWLQSSSRFRESHRNHRNASVQSTDVLWCANRIRADIWLVLRIQPNLEQCGLQPRTRRKHGINHAECNYPWRLES